jgi:hypothetical protein
MLMSSANGFDREPLRLPPELRKPLTGAVLVGSGKLGLFGLTVYEARLWARPPFSAEHYERSEFALEIHYERKLSGSAIADRSIAEMHRIGSFSEKQSESWLHSMQAAFPDIDHGDRLTGYHDGTGHVAFFHNGAATASIDDAEFARLFFGIWLSEKTSARGLRADLIGAAGPGFEESDDAP